MRRRAMMGAEKDPDLVLYDYATGTGYMDTGLVASTTLRVEITAIRSTVNSDMAFAFGYRQNTAVGGTCYAMWGGSNSGAYFRMGGDAAPGKIPANPNKFTAICDGPNGIAQIKNASGTVIGSATYTPAAPSGPAVTAHLWYRKTNGGNSNAVATNAKSYECKVYDNGTLVRDFVACTYKGDKGFWDIANDKFYEPVGSISVDND